MEGKPKRRSGAFSLVELSIVLVILGLLTGGVLTGQSLIRAAELRSIANDYQRYMTAVRAFQNQYIALPGDMNNATLFWKLAGGTGKDDACRIVASTDAKTCDGDGNGQVGSESSTLSQGVNERFRFWQHLANAGLIEGSYNGTGGSAGAQQAVVGSNVPASKMSSIGWQVKYISPGYAGDGVSFAVDLLHFYIIGRGQQSNNSLDSTNVMTAAEAWNIDIKLDDGKPATGHVIGGNWPVCTNAGSKTNFSATYLVTDATKNCTLYFANLF